MGVWIGILGLLGVIVTLVRDPKEISRGEKAIWIVVLFTLLLLEMKSVYQDRNEHDEAERQSRERSEQNFSAIANGVQGAIDRLNTTIEEGRKHFDATMNLEREGIDQITGGKSYIVVDAVPNPHRPEDDELALSIAICAKCVDSVSARIYMTKASPALTPYHEPPIFEGTIDSNGQYAKEKIKPDTVGTTGYAIRVRARNRPTTEALEVRFNWKEREWESSWIISRDIRSATL